MGAYFGSKHIVTSHPCSPARAGQITDLILDWIVDSTRPLSIVTDKGLVQLLAFLEPVYTVPSPTHFASLLHQRHHKAKAELTDLLAREGSAGIALTTDAWTSSATQSYATHTVHFIDREWSLVSALLTVGRPCSEAATRGRNLLNTAIRFQKISTSQSLR